MASGDATVFKQAATPLVLMLSRQTWMLTKFRHHVNTVGIRSQKFRANFCDGTLLRNLRSVVHVTVVPVQTIWRINANTRILSATIDIKLAILNERVYVVSVHSVIRNMSKQHSNANTVSVDTTELPDVSDDTDALYHVFSVTGSAPLKTQVTVNGVPVLFQIHGSAKWPPGRHCVSLCRHVRQTHSHIKGCMER